MMSTKPNDDSLITTMGKSKIKRPEKSKPDSERDSGFSDASSEHWSVIDQTDTEDAARQALGSRSLPSQLAVLGGSFQNLSPMIIMNNVLLKQPGDSSSSLKPWGFSPAVEVVQQPQVVFLQPVISQRTAKGPPSKRRKHKKYLPILKSYPKIAPHPGDNQRSSYASSTSSSNSNTTASVKSCSSSSSSWDHPHGEKQQGLESCISSSVCSPPIRLTPTRHLASSPQPNIPITDSDTDNADKTIPKRLELIMEPTDRHLTTLQTQPLAISKDDSGDQGNDSDSSKRKRFCNTYNVLSKSGLLDITLRTKELIRQNCRTQVELDKLREHTNLFMEALQTGDLHIWSKLQLSMQEENEREKVVNAGSETQNAI